MIAEHGHEASGAAADTDEWFKLAPAQPPLNQYQSSDGVEAALAAQERDNITAVAVEVLTTDA